MSPFSLPSNRTLIVFLLAPVLRNLLLPAFGNLDYARKRHDVAAFDLLPELLSPTGIGYVGRSVEIAVLLDGVAGEGAVGTSQYEKKNSARVIDCRSGKQKENHTF